ncbi:MAG: MipA/OmpV family protein [Halieaceae bacterium]|jgi:outer membrane protein|nr:MipA/OmpV family protein [Halieaceae bacterium]
MIHPRILLVTMLALLLTVPQVQAQWELGAGVIFRDPVQQGADSDPFVVPLILYTGERVYLRGIEAGVRLHSDDRQRTHVFARPRLDGFKSSDDAFLEGMVTRRNSMDLGLRHTLLFGSWQLSAQATTDALGRNDGQTLTGTVSYAFGSPRSLLFVPYAGVEWMSADLVDYYYGVRDSETAPGRPAYSGSDVWNLVYGARVVAPLTPRLTFQGIAAGTHYGDAVADSPLTQDRNRAITILGVSYRF